MITMTDGFNANHLAAEICKLQNRAEQAEDALAYWKDQAEYLKRVLHAVELLDCSAITIENNGCESLPWEISICTIWDGENPARRRIRDQYFGATLKDALERLAKKEVGV